MRKTFLIIIILTIPIWAIAYVFASDKSVNLDETSDDEDKEQLDDSSIIEFDPIIEQKLKEQFGTTKLTKNFIQSVEKLDLSELDLTTAEELKHFSNVKNLKLNNNLLTDTSFLNEMKQLEKLNLSDNQLEEITLSSNKIRQLKLQGNRIISIEFITSLKNLTDLNIRDNDVEDLSPLESLKQLTHLNIRGNKIKSLKSLSGLEKLDNLNARNNQIQSIESIINLPLTERFYINGNDIKDIQLFKDKIYTINDTDIEFDIPKPTFSVESGVFNKSFNLELETTEDHEIFYTIDGSIPNFKSNKYTGPIEISKQLMNQSAVISNNQTSLSHEGYSFSPSQVKKAVTITAVSSFKEGNLDGRVFSKPISQTYILEESLFNSKLPVISLVIDPKQLYDYDEGIFVPGKWYEDDSLWSGNYYLKGREHEKNAKMSYFQPDGNLDFQQDIGIRINGKATRTLPQKSLRLYSRSDYGQSRFYSSIFRDLPYDEFNLLILRNSGQDFNSTLLRDGLMHELVKEKNVDVLAYQPSIVLINGEYFGISNIREKFNEDYIDIKYNVKENDLVLMKVKGDQESIDFDMKAGLPIDKLHYFQLTEYVEKNDMTNDSNLEYVNTLMDIDNFLHYVAYQIYYVNTDSFSNNLMVWRKNADYNEKAPYGHDGRWRWMLFDLDFGMGMRIHSNTEYEDDAEDFNMIKHVMEDEDRMTLFREVIKNEEVKKQFIQIMMDLLNNNFESSNVKNKIDELANQIRPEIQHSITRWENIPSVAIWEENLQELYHFAEKRPSVIKKHLMQQFELTEEELNTIAN